MMCKDVGVTRLLMHQVTDWIKLLNYNLRTSRILRLLWFLNNIFAPKYLEFQLCTWESSYILLKPGSKIIISSQYQDVQGPEWLGWLGSKLILFHTSWVIISQQDIHK